MAKNTSNVPKSVNLGARVLNETCARLHVKTRVLERLLHLFSGLNDIRQLHEDILDAAMEAIPSEAGSLLLVTSEEGELTIVSARGPVANQVKGMKLVPGQGIAGACANDSQTFAISDVMGDSRHAAEISKSLGFKAASILATPIRHKGQVLGVIELINKKKENVYPQHEVELIERVAQTAGTLLELAGEKS